MAEKPLKAAKKAAKPRIAPAAGAIALSQNKDLAKRIEAAMSQAVADAKTNDPDKIRAAMLKAREAVLKAQ